MFEPKMKKRKKNALGFGGGWAEELYHMCDRLYTFYFMHELKDFIGTNGVTLL